MFAAASLHTQQRAHAMPKSDLRKVIAAFCPESISVPGTGDISCFPVVLQDLACQLSNVFGTLAKKEETFTLDDLVRRIFQPAVTAVSKGVILWCAIQDKASCVTAAKHPEWSKRCKSKYSVPMQHVANFDDPKPGHEWYSLFNHVDRRNKNFIVRQITLRATHLIPIMLQEANAPSHHRLVIDCDELSDPQGVGIRTCRPRIWPLSSVSEDKQDDVHKAYNAQLVLDLSNKLGEYDVCFLHHLNSDIVASTVEAIPDAAVLMETVDTDILLIAALRSEETRVPARIQLGLPKNIVLPSCSTHDEQPKLYYFDPKALRNWICGMLRVTVPCSDQEIMRQFCVLYLMGGSDFCHDGIPNTSTETLIREYLQSGGPATDFLQHKLNSVCSVLSGRVNKSNASARSLVQMSRGTKLQQGGLQQALNLAKHVAYDYWSNSASSDRVVGLPAGHGTALKGGKLVFAADL